MVVAVMQPYFFPYIGYFQLMHAVDTFVFFDDVQYIDRGWVNRNRIPLGGKAAWLSMPVAHADRRLAINHRQYLLDPGAKSILQRIEAAYPRRKEQEESQLIAELIGFKDPNVAKFNANLLRRIAGSLSIKCDLLNSSEILGQCSLRGEDRIIEICKRLGAKKYINSIGGMALYDSNRFLAAGAELRFINTTCQPSVGPTGAIHYSIIDTLMRKGLAGTSSMLDDYELVSAHNQQ